MASLCHERRRSPHTRRPACARHTRLNRRPRFPKAAHAGTDAGRDLPCGLRRAGDEGQKTNALISDRRRDRWFLQVFLRSSALTAQWRSEDYVTLRDYSGPMWFQRSAARAPKIAALNRSVDFTCGSAVFDRLIRRPLARCVRGGVKIDQ
jgi:hypothetical protein